VCGRDLEEVDTKLESVREKVRCSAMNWLPIGYAFCSLSPVVSVL
jgi:hypothetical protein